MNSAEQTSDIIERDIEKVFVLYEYDTIVFGKRKGDRNVGKMSNEFSYSIYLSSTAKNIQEVFFSLLRIFSQCVLHC